MCWQGRASADGYPGHCGVCGDRVRRELGRHRALRPQQAGLAAILLDPGPWHSLARHLPARLQADFMLIDPDAFEACFSAWAQSFAAVVHREVVAIDGKT